ncbi:tyrosine-protein kinase family protein [Actibacterium sp. 188UL27-1]|uniref:tyrosine-protein kinase family protein n=1 Tax=Actibacterium sp. 188UL27-1 TaxID=2786961 RepID=UPI00195D978A|nr:AAA family ATPase [Actibacterium sp. 188UL27-1]MBM7068988.1 AAA family ATPase [Actibacterium sp. 188UL27-1]
MEKLQAALQKAREKRAETLNEPTPTKSARPKSRLLRNDKPDLTTLWADLEPMDIDKTRLRRRKLLTIDAGHEATPFDMLRTKVLQTLAANDWKRIAITSPSPGSGKTTTSANLAASLSRQSELRIMLMDMDMRRPALSNAFMQRGTKSTSDVLEGRVTFADQALWIGTNLAISMNFNAMRDPSDLFLRQRTSEVLDEIEKTYKPNVMLFDMPPLLVNDDTSAFLKNVDCAMIVVEAGVSTLEQVDMCEKELAEQTNVMGMVLNKCRFHSDGYGYYSYNKSY